MADEATWKRRFHLYMGARLIGLLTVFAGLAIMFTDLLRDGGWRLAGAVVILLGLGDAVIAPMLLKKQWRKEDSAEADATGDSDRSR